MSENKNAQLESKRKALKTLLGSSGAVAGASVLPQKWSNPLISSVVLPVHATASGCPDCEPVEFTLNNPIPSISTTEVTILMEASGQVACDVPVSLEVNYKDESAESQSFEVGTELGLLLEGLALEAFDPGGTEAYDISEVDSVEALFDYCGQELDIEYD
jgi:hypothetical protein